VVEADGHRYLFGLQDALALGFTFRSTLTITPALSIQAYAQLFTSHVRATGLYLADGTSGTVRLAALAPIDADPSAFDERETQLNLNLVARWEFLPGSALYLVYVRSADGAFDGAQERPRIDLSSLGRGPATDTVMLKISYHFAR
jgi:hypothetical protein